MILQTANGPKEIKVADLDFTNLMCDLEDHDVDVMGLLDDDTRENMKIFKTIRAIIAVLTGTKDLTKAGKILSEHLKYGGGLYGGNENRGFWRGSRGTSEERRKENQGGNRVEEIDLSKYKTFTEIINKVWLPNALLYGVSYETFWTLNPTKLEPFQKKREMEAKEQATALDTLAWSVGSYVVDAMAIFLGRNAPAYPSQPRSMNSTEDAPPGAKMTDADRFAAFAAEHNKRLRQRREK